MAVAAAAVHNAPVPTVLPPEAPMRTAFYLTGTAVLLALWLSTSPAADEARVPAEITWKKTVIDKAFRSEGVAVADVNKDGKMDILTGEVWYEAPDWKMHEICPSKDYRKGDQNVYSNSFACWTEDLNGDGYPDLIVVGFPGAPCHWYENPKGKTTHWKKHVIWHSACNETPQYVDLFKTGKRVLLMGWQPGGKDNQGQMAYFTPGKDPAQLWEMHPISEPSTPPTFVLKASSLKALKEAKLPAESVTLLSSLQDKVYDSPKAFLTAVGKVLPADELKAFQSKIQRAATVPGKIIPGTFRFSHGLGVGDVNGDGRLDVICTGGWWEQPAKPDGKTPWKFHPAPLGPDCADMYAYDVDGDGKPDVISSSAHGQGIWWHRQIAGKDGNPTFQRRDLFARLVSQTHAMVMADINGDGVPDLVTGKRWWAHGKTGDVDPGAPAVLYWFEGKKSKDGLTTWTPRVIDNDSGIGTQFTVADVNGDKLLDVVISNKKGTFLFEQVRGKK
jgi:hypothetical protein